MRRLRLWGAVPLLVLAMAQSPLTAPEAVITDLLPGASPVASTGDASTLPTTATATPVTVPTTGDGAAGSSSWQPYSAPDLLLLLVAALATGLALVGLRERIRVSGIAADPRASGADLARQFPAPARSLILAPGTSGAGDTFHRAAERRFALRVDALVLPVLARPPVTRGSWTGLHDCADSWLWHESWLRAPAHPGLLVADGLVVGDGELRGESPVPELWVVPPGASVGVVPVSEGIILSRRAAVSVAELRARWVQRTRVWRAEAATRPAAALQLAQAAAGLPLAVVLPVVALLVRTPVEVTAVSFGPLVVGLVAAALRWAALDDLDRSTSLRFPVGQGVLLVLTAPLHAAVVWTAAMAGLRSPPPQPPATSALRGREAA